MALKTYIITERPEHLDVCFASDDVLDGIEIGQNEYPVCDLLFRHRFDDANILIQKGYRCLHEKHPGVGTRHITDISEEFVALLASYASRGTGDADQDNDITREEFLNNLIEEVNSLPQKATEDISEALMHELRYRGLPYGVFDVIRCSFPEIYTGMLLSYEMSKDGLKILLETGNAQLAGDYTDLLIRTGKTELLIKPLAKFDENSRLVPDDPEEGFNNVFSYIRSLVCGLYGLDDIAKLKEVIRIISKVAGNAGSSFMWNFLILICMKEYQILSQHYWFDDLEDPSSVLNERAVELCADLQHDLCDIGFRGDVFNISMVIKMLTENLNRPEPDTDRPEPWDYFENSPCIMDRKLIETAVDTASKLGISRSVSNKVLTEALDKTSLIKKYYEDDPDEMTVTEENIREMQVILSMF